MRLHKEAIKLNSNICKYLEKLLVQKNELLKEQQQIAAGDFDPAKNATKSISFFSSFFSPLKKSPARVPLLEETNNEQKLIEEEKINEKLKNIDQFLVKIISKVTEVTEGIPRDYGLSEWVQKENPQGHIERKCRGFDPHKTYPSDDKPFETLYEMQQYIPYEEGEARDKVDDAKDLVKETVKDINNIKKNLESIKSKIMTKEPDEDNQSTLGM